MHEESPKSRRGSAPQAAATVSFHDHVAGIVGFATLLALLYFGRGVLIPFTLAILLSLLIAPVVRAFRRIGLGQTASVLAAVVVSALAFMAAAAVLGVQFLRMAANLPNYEHTLQQKLRQLDEVTVGRLDSLTREAGRVIESSGPEVASSRPLSSINPAVSSPNAVAPVQLQPARAQPFEVLARVLARVWPPIEATGIVLVVLVFVLLEYEALRDRFIRLVGSTNIRLTTLALNDAGERLSRFFVSQFAVNLAVGAAVSLGLALLGLPDAMLWGALAAVLRFVPYVGIWLATVLATGLAMMVAPGWSLAVSVLATFVLIELVAGQVIEPHLYGHATGLSPLSVVMAAIFWSALWGPIGLIVSTPLTLCLLVIGRHLKALRFLELVLADRQALTPSQKFYQRVLSGDADEIIAAGRAFLKRGSFAEYCDRVLLPALHLGALDFAAGAISQDHQIKMRNVVFAVVSALGGEKTTRLQRRGGNSVLDELSPGALLRQERERRMGKWQGPVEVPPSSVFLCVGLALPAHVLAAELLVRALRDEKLDARHISIEELETWTPPAGADPSSIAVVYVVSAFPGAQAEQSQQLCAQLRAWMPNPFLVAGCLPGMAGPTLPATDVGGADLTVSSFGEAIQIGLERHHRLAEGEP